MGIAASTVRWLRDNGHDVVHVRDEQMQRAPDDVILTKARAEARTVLTLDLDFGYLLAVSGATLPSVIILRLGNETSATVTLRLADALTRCASDLLDGAIVAVDDDRVRVRRLPIARD